MLQHVAVQRIERGIVDVGREHAFAQIIEHHHASHSTQSAKRFLVQLGPDPRAGAEHQKANRFPAVSQRHHEQPRAPVLAGVRIAHHRTGAVIDLRFFAGRGFNHHAGFRRGRSAQLPHEALDAGVSPGETVAVHQVLPDGHRVAALRQLGFDDLPVGFAGARRRTGPASGSRPRDHFRPQSRWTPLWPVLDGRVPTRLAVAPESPPPSDRLRRFRAECVRLVQCAATTSPAGPAR